jgi:DNA-binding NarL/FixJ family response regulator
MANEGLIRVIIVDASPFLRSGLKLALEAEEDFEVVAEYGTAAAAVAEADQIDPHVVLLSVTMPDLSGFEACLQILEVAPRARVIMLASQVTSEEIFSTMMAGAAGYLSKNSLESDLVRIVRANGNGEMLLIPEVAEFILSTARFKRRVVDTSSLTEREKQVLFLAAEGLNNATIGDKLALSPHTIRGHIRRIYDKLHLVSRAELGALAVMMGRPKVDEQENQ